MNSPAVRSRLGWLPSLCSALLAFLLLAGCEARPNWDYTLTPGVYALGPTLCVSTMQPPVHPSAARKLALFAFEDLTTHTLELAYPDTVETVASADCSLRILRSLARNSDGILSLRHNRRHLWSPEGCHLRLRFDEIDYPVGPDTSNAFEDKTDLSEEITYVLIDHENGKALTTLDRSDYQALWKEHGCGPIDRLFQTLTPVPSA